LGRYKYRLNQRLLLINSLCVEIRGEEFFVVLAVNITTISMLLGKTTDNGIGNHMLLTNKPKAGEEEARTFLTFCSSSDGSDRRSSVHSLEQGMSSPRAASISACCNVGPSVCRDQHATGSLRCANECILPTPLFTPTKFELVKESDSKNIPINELNYLMFC
jgi:hypothetical protein